jgi:hypothetical protein
VTTRVRLAGTQTVTVVAELSGKRFLVSRTEVLVTSARVPGRVAVRTPR